MRLAQSGPENSNCPNWPKNIIFGVLGGAQEASQSMGGIEQKGSVPTVVTQNFARVQSAPKNTCSRQSLALALFCPEEDFLFQND